MKNINIPPLGPVTTPEPLPESLPNLTPGDLIRKELVALGLNQGELAIRTNLSAKHINQVIKNVVPISTDTALRVERATGISATLLTALQARWDAREGRREALASLAEYKEWFDAFPHEVLVNEHVISKNDPIEDQISSLLHFFGVVDPSAYDQLLADSLVSFRRAQHLQVDQNATALWMRLGEREAETKIRVGEIPSFSKKAFQDLLEELPSLTKERPPKSFERLTELCRGVGVIVILLAEVRGARANAVTRWVANRPVVILTDRGKFEDTVWFNFFHEAGHILLHPKRKSAVNLDGEGDDVDGYESEANKFATSYLLRHTDEGALAHVTTVARAQDLAKKLDVDPGIVAGQAAYRYQRYPKLRGARHSYQIGK